jgi:predicted acyl esterase
VRRRLVLTVVAALSAVLAVSTLTPVAAGAATASASPTVQPSVHQIAVTGAATEARAVLHDRDGAEVARKRVDTLGSVLFRDVPAGSGYEITVDGTRIGDPVTVLAPDDPPPPSLYDDQRIDPGYGYVTTRDGTRLAINVKLPGPVEEGPYPTVIEYSGYDPANPDGTQPSSRIAQLLGYATVGVNLRGTGCSGGAYNYFEELEALDGYDVVEAVAAQPWVRGGTVGMIGISFPGITQLFVAKTRPPHLSAITPLSVLDDTYDTLYPGGIFNNGFALGWAKDREADAKPATRAGQGQEWARKRIAEGDETCRENQALRLQSADVMKEIAANAFRRGPASDALAPESFVHDIDVPVFLAGTWQDQETGSHFAQMLDDFSPDIPMKIMLMNGIHQDSIGPAVVSQWLEFLDFYVAKEIPSIPVTTRAVASVLLSGAFGGRVTLAPDRFTDQPDFASALRAYQAEPRVQVLFDVGRDGSPMPAFSSTAPSFPLPDTEATTWYLGEQGALRDTPPASTGADRFEYDPSAFPRTMETIDSNGFTPTYGWEPVPAGKALGYVTEPLPRDTVLAGTGSVDLWVRASKPDVDLEVTISEVRPDGEETYVQSGWLRASQRALDTAASTDLLPLPTHRRADVEPLPTSKPALVRVPLYPFAHAFRAGSRIRIVVQPPGGNRPAWAFAALPGPRTVTVSRSAAQPSKVVLPVVSGVEVSTPLPACDTLRGQPCRAYEPTTNRSAGS